jgi:arginyl-tRNA synthetase
MTQDLGTAVERYNDYKFDNQYYVVGNEQNYHFQVLRILLKRLGYEWFGGIQHYSYGMVELPEGKMKSREGKIVDADDLIREMISTAREMSMELGKLEDYSKEEKEDIFRMIGLGALKYFILKVDPKKNMLFDPAESIDFNGNTGPFIQYTYARINSLIRKAGKMGDTPEHGLMPNTKEINLIKSLRKFPVIITEAGESLSPALIANYCYELAKEFNQFYHDYTILGESDKATKVFRIRLSQLTGETLIRGMGLLGIEMPERI